MSDIYNQTLANLVGQQLAQRGVTLSPSDLLDRLLNQETLAHHLNMMTPDEVSTLAEIGRQTVPGWQAS
jgi:hypothetical protein